MVSARGPYADNWEQFFKKIRDYSPKQRKTLLEEAQIDPKLAMIHGLARQWVARNNDPIRRVQGRQARILEERRMTPDPTAFRDYLDPGVRAMLPAIAVKRRYGKDRVHSQQAARRFWHAIEGGSWRGRTIAQIVARSEEISAPAWIAAHPYGPPVSQADLDNLAAVHRSVRPAPKPRIRYAPAGMTPERALQIALAVREGHGG